MLRSRHAFRLCWPKSTGSRVLGSSVARRVGITSTSCSSTIRCPEDGIWRRRTQRPCPEPRTLSGFKATSARPGRIWCISIGTGSWRELGCRTFIPSILKFSTLSSVTLAKTECPSLRISSSSTRRTPKRTWWSSSPARVSPFWPIALWLLCRTMSSWRRYRVPSLRPSPPRGRASRRSSRSSWNGSQPEASLRSARAPTRPTSRGTWLLAPRAQAWVAQRMCLAELQVPSSPPSKSSRRLSSPAPPPTWLP
mmetsp:Transcript_22556/g.65590  ORF Transcript_22556/g.65590 Transcript_22556/m.65590 type:complete len:252 (+) Transcript_22556:248-1003(+)